jgi:hypothetical protein
MHIIHRHFTSTSLSSRPVCLVCGVHLAVLLTAAGGLASSARLLHRLAAVPAQRGIAVALACCVLRPGHLGMILHQGFPRAVCADSVQAGVEGNRGACSDRRCSGQCSVTSEVGAAVSLVFCRGPLTSMIAVQFLYCLLFPPCSDTTHCTCQWKAEERARPWNTLIFMFGQSSDPTEDGTQCHLTALASPLYLSSSILSSYLSSCILSAHGPESWRGALRCAVRRWFYYCDTQEQSEQGKRE